MNILNKNILKMTFSFNSIYFFNTFKNLIEYFLQLKILVVFKLIKYYIQSIRWSWCEYFEQKYFENDFLFDNIYFFNTFKN